MFSRSCMFDFQWRLKFCSRESCLLEEILQILQVWSEFGCNAGSLSQKHNMFQSAAIGELPMFLIVRKYWKQKQGNFLMNNWVRHGMKSISWRSFLYIVPHFVRCLPVLLSSTCQILRKVSRMTNPFILLMAPNCDLTYRLQLFKSLLKCNSFSCFVGFSGCELEHEPNLKLQSF